MNVNSAEVLSEKWKLQSELQKVKKELVEKARVNQTHKSNESYEIYRPTEQSWKTASTLFSKTKAEVKKQKCGKQKEKSSYERFHKSKKEKSKREKQKGFTSRKSSSSDSGGEITVRSRKMERQIGVDISIDKHVSKKDQTPLAREEWMVSRMLLPTYLKNKKEIVKNNNESSSYDPCQSSRELNPYWKSGGNGVPSWKIPMEGECSSNCKSVDKIARGPKIQKHDNERLDKRGFLQPCQDLESSWKCSIKTPVRDKDLNKLGAQIIKAEIMGDMDLVRTLKIKLEGLKSQHNRSVANSKQETRVMPDKSADEDFVLLSTTDDYGVVRPLPPHKKSRTSLTKSVETHSKVERSRYFPDDDRYDLKNMFEREKHATSSSSNAEFVEMMSLQKREADNMDDIFVDEIRKTSKDESKSKEKAVRDHEKFVKILDSCKKCFYSSRIDRDFIVSEGLYVYLAIPWHEGLQKYHCVIIPKEHISCSTRLDENVWSEVTAFRKALCRAFEKNSMKCIFFETAVSLQRKPHCVIHCVPGKNFDVMPLYFKKAILESENDWSINKQLITLKEKGLRQIIPKELPYFWVNFGMENGFAHVVEDQNNFPVHFAEEIIGNFLELEPNRWRRPRKEQNHSKKMKQFIEVWKNYDVTRYLETT